MSATALASGTELSDASQLLALLDRLVDAGKQDGAGEVDDRLASPLEVNPAAGRLRLPLPSIARRRPECDPARLVGPAANDGGTHHRSWGGAQAHYSVALNDETGGA